MLKMGPARLLLVVAFAAGCAPQDANDPSPPGAPDAAPADDEKDRIVAETPLREIGAGTPVPDSARSGEAFHGLVFQRERSSVYEVAHEARQVDVRDTSRIYNEKSGQMIETPVDGTTNPAKVAQNAEWERKAATHAHRDAVLLVETHRRFRELFAEKLKLPELPPDRLPLRITVLWNRDAFDRELARVGTPASPGVRAVWQPESRGVLTYHGDDAFQALDEWRCADGRVQKECDQVVATAATGQLMREYAGARRGSSLDSDASLGPPWFRKGFAEFLGGVEVGIEQLETLEGAMWQHERIVLPHVFTARRERDLAEKWTLAELLRVKTTGDRMTGTVLDRGEALAPGSGASMGELFAIRAWALCHFLWNYDGGKYRDRFVGFVGRALDGDATSDVFATQIMGRPSAADWGDVEMEFEWYWLNLLERRVGRDMQTKQWHEPSTDPPQGSVKDDADFLEFWAESHPAPKDRPR